MPLTLGVLTCSLVVWQLFMQESVSARPRYRVGRVTDLVGCTDETTRTKSTEYLPTGQHGTVLFWRCFTACVGAGGHRLLSGPWRGITDDKWRWNAAASLLGRHHGDFPGRALDALCHISAEQDPLPCS